ncbi:hypothetical protein [Brasilonema sp. UFV-L1]|uniref:hypothetical protein n=1 Tax=Brasilonema sp. UFV-L1 TaxID=2234130 RepID=UPI00145D73DB|nr:hypothetical protein [Brasilonema sp. UFV-L1]NMG11912.1 hypothetical protein [Brasilonema sp. UFV-L1]
MGTKGNLAEQNDDALLLRIKRAPNTDDGIVFAYLASQRQPQTDLACEAIRPYWLPLAIKERGVKGKELKSVGLKAIAQLMQQIEIIRLECGLRPDEMPFAFLLRKDLGAVPTNTTTTSRAISTNNTATGTDKTIADTKDFDEEEEDESDSDVVDDDFLDFGGI